MSIVKIEDIADLIIELRETKLILDNDVAKLYGVETRDINKAVKNNPDKFSSGYIIEITKEELKNLRWKFSTTKLLKKREFYQKLLQKKAYIC